MSKNGVNDLGVGKLDVSELEIHQKRNSAPY